MPISIAELQDRLKAGLDYYIKNKPPVDQVALERPFFKALMSKKKAFTGAAQYVVEQIRTNYGGNGRRLVTTSAKPSSKQNSHGLISTMVCNSKKTA